MALFVFKYILFIIKIYDLYFEPAKIKYKKKKIINNYLDELDKNYNINNN